MFSTLLLKQKYNQVIPTNVQKLVRQATENLNESYIQYGQL